MEARYFDQYARDDGRVRNNPPSVYDAHRWYREFRLEVTIGGERLGASHREFCMAPYVNDPEFEAHMRRRLASMIGRYIEDQIRDQL